MFSAIRKALVRQAGDDQAQAERQSVPDRIASLCPRELEVMDGHILRYLHHWESRSRHTHSWNVRFRARRSRSAVFLGFMLCKQFVQFCYTDTLRGILCEALQPAFGPQAAAFRLQRFQIQVGHIFSENSGDAQCWCAVLSNRSKAVGGLPRKPAGRVLAPQRQHQLAIFGLCAQRNAHRAQPSFPRRWRASAWRP